MEGTFGLTDVTQTFLGCAKRGKVLFTPEDRDHYNATRHFDPGFAIAEQRYFYKAHWVRSVLLLEGQPYLKSFQWKHERVNWRNTIVDGDCEIKVHDYPNGGGGLMTFVNRSVSDKRVYSGKPSACTATPLCA